MAGEGMSKEGYFHMNSNSGKEQILSSEIFIFYFTEQRGGETTSAPHLAAESHFLVISLNVMYGNLSFKWMNAFVSCNEW